MKINEVKLFQLETAKHYKIKNEDAAKILNDMQCAIGKGCIVAKKK